MDDQTLFTLMVDLHRDGIRQGPGSREETLRALELSRLDRAAELQVADIGCGTGASTLALASMLPSARIIAVDLEFLRPVTFEFGDKRSGRSEERGHDQWPVPRVG